MAKVAWKKMELEPGLPATPAAGGTVTYDLDTEGFDKLLLAVQMNGAADADLTVAIKIFLQDGSGARHGRSLPLVRSSGPTHVGGVVSFIGQYDLCGVDRVRIDITNNNAGVQNLTDVDAWLSA